MKDLSSVGVYGHLLFCCVYADDIITMTRAVSVIPHLHFNLYEAAFIMNHMGGDLVSLCTSR